ncbi:MAG: cytochrome c biogenesis protein CcsA [Flavobacteriales bacterium]|nr:cytochrome c biogenesis protein CcsA [Flavobacteriales bacterium]
MEPVNYIGEHGWAGHWGHWLALISFTGALFSGIGYLLFTQNGDTGWRSVGRICFRAHSLAVLGIIVTLFVMLFKHWFEFDYVWKHSNTLMPLQYIASCFWEGQEGSFLLFTFWIVVLGNLLILRAKEWEGPVLTVFALVQVFLASMLLGVYIFDVRIGSSPFLLIRELPENLGLPWTKLGNYLTRIPQFKDGRGLNPLLQNYWMVIHPPTLFLGFASTLVPFSFAIAGLWKNRLKDWMTPALPWTFFGIMVLGTGILMGGAWAYEALSFGGFWAWDPVENGSLIPWLTLLGSGHLLLINKRKETSVFTTLLLSLGTFLLVLYSTFLTRSGVLGDTSVHSFTGEGMLPGLLTFMLVFVLVATTMLNSDKQWRLYYLGLGAALLLAGAFMGKMSTAILIFALLTLLMTLVAYFTRSEFKHAEEEDGSSREFWLFIGSLVLLLSAIQITWTTSIPVYNLLMGPFGEWAKRAPPVETIEHYNKWQIPFAFIVALLVAVGQYLRYRTTDPKKLLRELALPFIGAFAITVFSVWYLGYQWREGTLIALFFATAFAALANLNYFISVLKGKLKNAGPSVAHMGFALVLLGALISTSRQKEISHNTKGPLLSSLSDDFDDGKDMLLYKGDTLPLGEHFVTYTDSRVDGVNMHFDMDYLRSEPRHFRKGDTIRVRNSIFVSNDDHTAGNSFLLDQPAHWHPLDSAAHRVFWTAEQWSSKAPGAKEFALEPFVQLNPRFGNVAEPSTRHWLQRDLYTHIRYAKLDPEDTTDYMPARLFEKNVGDTIITPTCLIVVDSIRVVQDSVIMNRLGPEYVAYAPLLKVRDLYDPTRWFEAKPVIVYRFDQPVGSKGFDIPALNVKLDLVSVKGSQLGINVYEREFVIMQAIVFPGINILWIGCVLMALGTGMAVWQRIRRN